MADELDPRATLIAAIKRETGTEEVWITEDDPGHVLVLDQDATGKPVYARYELSPSAQQFLAGEFPDVPVDGLVIEIHRPRP